MELDVRIRGIKKLIDLVYINENITDAEKEKIIGNFKKIIERIKNDKSSSEN